MLNDDLIGLCAAGEAAWLAVAYAGLGSAWCQDDGLAWAPAGSPHRYLVAAVTLVPSPVLPQSFVRRAPGVLRDSWATLTADDLPGWTPSPADPWMVREPGRCIAPTVSGVRVDRTVDALLFEDTAFRAAGGAPPASPGELHPAGSGSIDGLHLFLARRGGACVGTVLAVRHERGIVVSALNVVGAERGRGIGSMLTAAAVSVDPGLPATLTASELGLRIYRRLGFRELASPMHWQPAP